MVTRVYIGRPKHCYNQNCKAIFYQESFLGWMPRTTSDAKVFMRCPKCFSTFQISQPYSIVYDYVGRLPKDPALQELAKTPLTLAEHKIARQLMDSDPKVLCRLFEGQYPQAVVNPGELPGKPK